MKKIIINGDYLNFGTFAGACRYASEILNELDSLVEPGNIELLVPEYTTNIPELRNITVVKAGNQSLSMWKTFFLPRYARKQKARLVDLTQAFSLRNKDVCCIFDCIPEKIESAYSGFTGKYIRKPIKLLQRKHAAKCCETIITISECSKNDIVKYYGVKEDKISIVPCGWQHINRVDAADDIYSKYPALENREFYFSLGSRVPHKNLKWIIEAAKQNTDKIFVVSGENSFATNFNEETFPVNVLFTGYISDEEIKAFMRECKAFILPSFYEGFGIPPLEAMSQGTEVIVSNTACFPEIYETSVHYIDPYNYDKLDIDQILSTQVDDPDRILRKYSWKKSAEKLKELLMQ